MTTRKHGETEAPVEGFQATLERGFDWINDNAKIVLAALIGALALGGLVAAVYEWQRASALGGQEALAKVEREYLAAMGATPSTVIVTEPANAEQARTAREAALAGFAQVATDYGGSLAGRTALIRAAEAEVDLGRLDAAAERLAPVRGWDADDAVTGIAARLYAYVLEELGQHAEAADTYAFVGRNSSYPARGSVWVSAAETYVRAGNVSSAIDAYRELIRVDPDFAQRSGAAARLEELAALAGDSPVTTD